MIDANRSPVKRVPIRWRHNRIRHQTDRRGLPPNLASCQRHGSAQEPARPARLKATGRRPRRRRQGRLGARARQQPATGSRHDNDHRPASPSTCPPQNLYGCSPVYWPLSQPYNAVQQGRPKRRFSCLFLDSVLDGGRSAICRRQKGKHEAARGRCAGGPGGAIDG